MDSYLDYDYKPGQAVRGTGNKTISYKCSELVAEKRHENLDTQF